jgi:hypothetical protein
MPKHTSTAVNLDGARSVPLRSVAAFEAQFTPKELAAAWKLSEDTIRRLFRDEPGVFKIGTSNPRGKRGYVTLRIPESVALRVFEERSR